MRVYLLFCGASSQLAIPACCRYSCCSRPTINSMPPTRRHFLALTPALLAAQSPRLYNIRDFGAKGDGATLDTAAVQAAIDTCHKDQGGTVFIPAGVFVIGTVEL